MTENQTNDPDQWRLLKIAVVVALSFWVVNFAFGLVTSCSEFGSRIGDSFGIVNALFSSVAVAGALYAVLLQQRQFANSKIDSERAAAQQRETAEIQAFSAYSQCLASCAQLAIMKFSEVSKRIDKQSTTIEPPDLTKFPLDEHESILKKYQELWDQKVENLDMAHKTAEFYHGKSIDLSFDLNVALESFKRFPSVVSKIPHSSEEEPTAADPSK
jgi:hypothetical protein